MSPIRMQKVESASRAALDLIKALNERKIDALDILLSEDCVLEDHYPPPEGTMIMGKMEIMAHWTEYFKGSPEVRIDIEDLSGFGDRCILRWRAIRNKDSSPLRGVDIIQVKDGWISLILSYVKG